MSAPPSALSAQSAQWLEVLTARYSVDCRDAFDVLVVFVHWCFVRAGCLCVGSPPPDREMTATRVAAMLRDSGGGSELLPPNWNSDPEGWSLAYKSPSSTADVILIKAVRVDDELLVNAMRPETDVVRSVSLVPRHHVVDGETSFKPERRFKKLDDLTTQIGREILEPFVPTTTKPETTDRPEREAPDDWRPDPMTDPYRGSSGYDGRNVDPLRDYGRADLDPFGGGQGGMMFDPLRVAGRGNPYPLAPDGRPLPPGSIPPGARFDPFAPFPPGGAGRGRGRGYGPDPDHELPPGYGDMFM